MKAQEGGSELRLVRRIEEVEQSIGNAGGVFGHVLIDEEAFFVQMTHLRKALPACLRQSVEIQRRVEAIIADADAEAQSIQAKAQAEAEQRLALATEMSDKLMKAARAQAGHIDEESSLVRQAREKAERITSEASIEAQRLAENHPLVQAAQAERQRTRVEQEQESAILAVQMAEFADAILNNASSTLCKLSDKVDEAKLNF